MTDEVTRIENPGASEYVSQVLGLVIQNLAGMGVSTEVANVPIPDKKSSLIIEITVGLGVTATWDILKFVVGTLNPSRRASAGDEITLNGKRYSITEINEEGSGDSENDD
ncbi:hypothetical protein HEP87_06510 [Streptomyces sp. S1D4-11]|nr:hypothetical protein [Streptomyces sp. S1D4-11]QIY93805.1 hypothetical protein HEP87_06510 [Streptomyces sp. S1D4-11]